MQVTGRFGNTPVLKFLHKGSRISSLTGEKLTEHQVVRAFEQCGRDVGIAVPLFTVCPAWAMPPYYAILLEESADGLFTGEEGARLIAAIEEAFDARLKALNIEYRSKRDSGRLGRPRVRLVEEGSFEKKKAARVAQSGGRLEQYKHPYLTPDLDYHSSFRPAAAGSDAAGTAAKGRC